MKEVKCIEVITENCEAFRFTRIGVFELEDVTRQIKRMGCNYIGEYSTCKQAIIQIFAEDNNQECNSSGYNTDDFKRIEKYNDITSINVIYDNDTEEEVYIEYEEANESLGAPNTLQDSYINKFGDLFITIGPKKIKDVFSEEELEDETYRNFQCEMIDKL